MEIQHWEGIDLMEIHGDLERHFQFDSRLNSEVSQASIVPGNDSQRFYCGLSMFKLQLLYVYIYIDQY